MRKSKQLTAIILTFFALVLGWIFWNCLLDYAAGYRYAPSNISVPK